MLYVGRSHFFRKNRQNQKNSFAAKVFDWLPAGRRAFDFRDATPTPYRRDSNRHTSQLWEQRATKLKRDRSLAFRYDRYSFATVRNTQRVNIPTMANNQGRPQLSGSEMSFEEIAADLHITASTARKLFASGLAKLRSRRRTPAFQVLLHIAQGKARLR